MATDREKLDDIFETPNKFSDVPVEQTLGALAWLVVRQRAEMIMFLNSLTLEPDTTAEITRGFAHMQRDFFDVVMVGVGVDTYSHPRMQHPMEAAINKQVKLLMAQGDMMSDLLDDTDNDSLSEEDEEMDDAYNYYEDEGYQPYELEDEYGSHDGTIINVAVEMSPDELLAYVTNLDKPEPRDEFKL